MRGHQKLVKFRELLYRQFFRRKDAIFELIDALSTSAKHCNSVVQLSKSPFFTRQYPSITDAITDGLEVADWSAIQKLAWKFCRSDVKVPYHRFLLDCTPNARPHAKTVADRSIVHYPNPAPGNKPICAGHQYSVATYLPPGNSDERQRWCVPLCAKRVPSHEKGHEFGMKQLSDIIGNLGLENETCVSIGDTAYGTEACHQSVVQTNNHVHIVRLKSNRNVFELFNKQPTGRKGRKKIYGEKMSLNNPATFLPYAQYMTMQHTSKKGKQLTISLKAWDNMTFRSSRQFDAYKYPFRLIQAIVTDSTGKAIFKHPLWLAVFGDKRMQISLPECFSNYMDRYDIEHYFRFGKQRLLMNAFQSSDVEHEENWWQLCTLAYVQLFLSKDFAQGMPEPWERYLPQFKHKAMLQLSSASHVQRGFAKVLETIGTPAQPPIPRGNPLGRKLGQCPSKRPENPVIFKKNFAKKKKAVISSGLKNQTVLTKPQNIDAVLKQLNLMIGNLDISMQEFCDFALDSS
jgi:hypothetical protein